MYYFCSRFRKEEKSRKVRKYENDRSEKAENEAEDLLERTKILLKLENEDGIGLACRNDGR